MNAARIKEIDTLFALARTPLSADAKHWIHSSLSDSPDWRSLIERAENWQVEPVVFQNLRTSFPDILPADVLEEVTRREREARGRALTRTLITVQLLKRIEAAGIPVILLKGPAVAVSAYGDASLRSFGDADLLVKSEDIARTRDLLLSSGFARDYEAGREATLIRDGHALEFSSSSLKVELHWTLFPRYMRLDFPLDDLWASSRSIPIVGSEVRVLSRAAEFLFLCGHGAKHEWMGVRWIVDVAQASARLDERDADETVTLAKRLRALRLLALGLRLARDLAGAEIQIFEMDEDALNRDTEALTKIVKPQIGGYFKDVPAWVRALPRTNPNLGPLIFWVRSRENVIDRYASLLRVLFVPSERNDGAGWIRWARRPLRLMVGAVRRPSATGTHSK